MPGPQQVSHQWATPQIAAAVAGLGVSAGTTALVGEQLADAIDQHLVTLGLDSASTREHLGSDETAETSEETRSSTVDNEGPARDAGSDSALDSSAGQSVRSPTTGNGSKDTASEIPDGLTGLETTSDVSVGAGDHGEAAIPGQAGQPDGGDIVGDLVAVGAHDEAVQAGGFGAQAITGDIGQALADESGKDGLSTPPESEHAAAATNAPEAGAPEPGA